MKPPVLWMQSLSEWCRRRWIGPLGVAPCSSSPTGWAPFVRLILFVSWVMDTLWRWDRRRPFRFHKTWNNLSWILSNSFPFSFRLELTWSCWAKEGFIQSSSAGKELKGRNKRWLIYFFSFLLWTYDIASSKNVFLLWEINTKGQNHSFVNDDIQLCLVLWKMSVFTNVAFAQMTVLYSI